MADNTSYQDLARRYGFAPKLESASRLTQLVARQDSDVDEIVKVINKDPALRDLLLRGWRRRRRRARDRLRRRVCFGVLRRGVDRIDHHEKRL